MKDYALSGLLDLAIVQKMADAHYRAAGMPIGIIDAIDGSVLVGSGWQDICVKFHRANPLSLDRCRESDNYIKDRLIQGEACHYKCQNGLWDIGIPIVVAGRHLATLFLGQFFYEGEAPDRGFFIRQAREFEFNENDYLAALDRVPVFSREKVDTILEYDKALAAFIADLAEHALSKIKADEKIQRQGEFLQVLVDAMPYPVYYKDRQGRYLGCNRAFEQFYGISREHIAGKTVHEIAPKQLADVHLRADEALFARPGTQTYEGSIQSADGVQHDVIFHKATFTGPDGALAGLVGAVVDITERVSLESQLRQAQKMESVGRLAGGIAHDFNNMLGVIIGHAELALDQMDPTQPLFAPMQGIQNAALRSADLTQQLLAFARKQTVAPRVLDLNRTVEGMLKMLRRLIGEDIDLVWLPGPDLWPVRMDPSQIDQILANLCVNARDAIAGVGNITIETHTVTFDEACCAHHAGFVPGDFVMLAVSDNGLGMDKETLEKIFEPFFTTKGMGKGTGLGLATAYGVVKQNNGFINVYSEPKQGSTFKIYLPRHAAKTGEKRKKSLVAPDTRGNETILLVEDEISILEIVRLMLEKLGYRILVASTPSEAITMAKEHAGEIHLLLTDVVMPEMNGRELAQVIISFCPGLRSLFMSGYTSNAIAHHGVLGDGINFIQKPFSMQTLAAKVREALDSEI